MFDRIYAGEGFKVHGEGLRLFRTRISLISRIFLITLKYRSMFSKALYYPTIDISDEDWLKTAYLFWDGIRTIVPESMADKAYGNNTTMFLAEVGFLEPIIVRPDSNIIRPLVKVVKNML